MTKKQTELFESEWVILRVVWEKEPCTAPDVQEALQKKKQWAYTTVKTMMDRMAKKGLLKVEKVRNLYLYRAAITRFEAQKREIARTVKRAFDGAFTPMMQFLVENESISPEECQQLKELIEKQSPPKKKSGR